MYESKYTYDRVYRDLELDKNLQKEFEERYNKIDDKLESLSNRQSKTHETERKLEYEKFSILEKYGKEAGLIRLEQEVKMWNSLDQEGYIIKSDLILKTNGTQFWAVGYMPNRRNRIYYEAEVVWLNEEDAKRHESNSWIPIKE